MLLLPLFLVHFVVRSGDKAENILPFFRHSYHKSGTCAQEVGVILGLVDLSNVVLYALFQVMGSFIGVVRTENDELISAETAEYLP